MADKFCPFEIHEATGRNVNERIALGVRRILKDRPETKVTAWLEPGTWETALRNWLAERREVNLIHESDGGATMATALFGRTVWVRADWAMPEEDYMRVLFSTHA